MKRKLNIAFASTGVISWFLRHIKMNKMRIGWNRRDTESGFRTTGVHQLALSNWGGVKACFLPVLVMCGWLYAASISQPIRSETLAYIASLDLTKKRHRKISFWPSLGLPRILSTQKRERFANKKPLAIENKKEMHEKKNTCQHLSDSIVIRL